MFMYNQQYISMGHFNLVDSISRKKSSGGSDQRAIWSSILLPIMASQLNPGGLQARLEDHNSPLLLHSKNSH